METAGLIVHLHVHVNFSNCDESCEIVSYGNLRDVKNVPIFGTLSLKVRRTYLSKPICLKISPQTLHRIEIVSRTN